MNHHHFVSFRSLTRMVSRKGAYMVKRQVHFRYVGLFLLGWQVLVTPSNAEEFKRFMNWFPMNGNTLESIIKEVESPSLINEMAINLQGFPMAANPRPTCRADVIEKDADSADWQAIQFKDVPDQFVDDLEQMLELYIRSRMLGLTRALATTRALIWQNNVNSIKNADDRDEVIARSLSDQFTLPPDLIRPCNALGLNVPRLLESQKDIADYALIDGDIVLWFRVVKDSMNCIELVPLDRRLIENKGLRQFLGRSVTDYEAEYSRLFKQVADSPSAQTIAAEMGLKWKALGKICEAVGIELFPATTHCNEFFWAMYAK